MILSPHQCAFQILSAETAHLRPLELKRRKVALMGFADLYHKQAPMDDPSWEVWGLNHAHRLWFMHDSEGRFRADRWFELHPLRAQTEDDLTWMRACPVPLYLIAHDKQFPLSVTYPLKAVEDYFEADYWCSSFAYMAALAIYEGFDTIGFFGCDLDWGRERAIEHGNLAYWAGLARGMGIELVIPPGSAFCWHPYRYGYDYEEERDWVILRMGRLVWELLGNAKTAECAREIQQEALARARQDTSWWDRLWKKKSSAT